MEGMGNLNERERDVLRVICDDCDDIEGEGFDRSADMMSALIHDPRTSGMSPQALGGYITALGRKGYVIINPVDDEVWVLREVFAVFC